MATKVKWYGDKLIKEVEQKCTNNIKRACFMVETDAKRMCVVDTGRLRSSICSNWTGSGQTRTAKWKKPLKGKDTTEIAEPRGKKDEIVGIVGTNVQYAVYVEYGTRKMSAKPYLRPALEKNKGKIKQLLGGK
ncbi:MAG: HK97 gp10 family phage protein [Desulfobacterales bacterium]|nr:HK97 gp10 family phage protein [Desulfobacterales bacterium]